MSRSAPKPGDRESQRLEFKQREKLYDSKGREDIVRSIVSFLNGEGGTIWIGVPEQAEHARAHEPIPRERWSDVQALQNVILDRIEPRARIGSEVKLERRNESDAGDFLLEIDIMKRGAASAYRAGNSREFPIRVGSSTRAMSWEEIAARLGAYESDHVDSSKVALRRLRETAKSTRVPAAHLSAIPSDFARSDQVLAHADKLLRSPPPEITLPHDLGCIARYVPPPRPENDKLVHGELVGGRPYKRIVVTQEGEIHFATAVDGLRSARESYGQMMQVGETLPQYASESLANYVEEALLTPLVVSFARLVERLDSGVNGKDMVRWSLVLSLRNCASWGLRLLNRPGRGAMRIGDKELESEVVVRSSEELRESPDRLAFELLRSLYDRRIVRDLSRPLELADFPGFGLDGRFVPPA